LSSNKRKVWQRKFDFEYQKAHSIALKAEYEYLIKEVEKQTNGRVKLSLGQIAAADFKRSDLNHKGDFNLNVRKNVDADRYLLVDGTSLINHPDFSTWLMNAEKTVDIPKSLQISLGFGDKAPKLKELIYAIKRGYKN